MCALVLLAPLELSAADARRPLDAYTLDYDTPVDPDLQKKLEAIDRRLRARYEMSARQTAVGVLDLTQLRLAMIAPDRNVYGASLPKIGILLAYFQLKPEAAEALEPSVREGLERMVKKSSNDWAARFSKELGLKEIQKVLDSYGFYDKSRGGGLWVGRHYAQPGERYGDPLSDYSHAATVRQMLRFYLLLEQGKLVSPKASKTMREIFAAPSMPHDHFKFVRALARRGVELARKWGSWRNWLHDSAIVTGPGRHYVLVAMTEHPKGDEYLVDLAIAIDDLLAPSAER